MPVEIGLWRIDGDQPRRVRAATLPSEARLEEFLERDPSLLGERLLVIGRQVRTPYGKYIDLLAIDGGSALHVLELKRDKTPREVVAQVLDYGSWVSALSYEAVVDIANAHLEEAFEQAFARVFGEAPPDELSTDLQLTVVASELDPSSERIVSYLSDFGVPINAVLFSYLEDEGRGYLARSWLVTREETTPTVTASRKGKRAEWNGRDWFVAFGEANDSRNWNDARKLGFVSAGGGEWYSRTLRALPSGARVNVHLPKLGYVGVGTVIGDAQRFEEAEVLVDGRWQPLHDQPLAGDYRHAGEGENAEWAVPVRWIAAVPRSEAFWMNGMFANQNSACKLRQEFTLERLGERFGLDNQSD